MLPDKSVWGSGININIKPSEQLAEELHKPIIRKFKKRTVYSRFKDIYAWVVPLKDKKRC